MKSSNFLDSLSMRLLSSRQTVRISVGDAIFYFKFDGVCVTIHREFDLIFSKRLSASVITPQHIKESLEKAFYWLDYDEFKEIYDVDYVPMCLLEDSFFLDWRDHCLFGE